MKQIVANIADNYGLWSVHRHRSRKSQFSPIITYPDSSNGEEFFHEPKLPDISFELLRESKINRVARFHFNSAVKSGYSKNDMVSGLYYHNYNSGSPVCVILVHGWRMDNLHRVQRIFDHALINCGYDLWYYTLPYHFERTPKEASFNGEFMVSADIGRTLTAVKQTVTDLRELVGWLKAKGRRVVIIGISLGGLMTNLLATQEAGIDALVSVFYANSLADAVWKTIPGKYIKRDLINNNITYTMLKEHWAVIEPSRYRPLLDKDKIFLISAKYDRYIDRKDSDYLWSAWNQPNRIMMECGHSGIVLKRKDSW